MADETVRLSTVGRLLRARWRLLAVCAVAGALLGAGASLLFPPGYETASRVLLQGSREDDELLTEAQIAMSSVVLDRAATALRWSGGDVRDAVTATVADGNVIEITGVADSPERAQQLTDRVAEEYVAFSTQLRTNTADTSAQVQREQRETLRKQVELANQQITELHAATSQDATVEGVQARTQLEALRTALNQAVTKLDEVAAASSHANMVVMGPAPRPTDPAAPSFVHFVAGGAVLSFVGAVFAHLFAARADKRLRGEQQIAAALGSAVLTSVTLPQERPEDRAGWQARLRRLVQYDRPWDVPRPASAGAGASDHEHDGRAGHDRDARYRRVLARLRDGSGGSARVLALVPGGDATAHTAAARLAELASVEGGRELDVVEVWPDRPTVPDLGAAFHAAGASEVVVVLTAGTRTAWELVGIAQGCADAGHAVVGAVVVRTVWPTGKPATPAKTPQAPKEPEPSNVTVTAGDAMAGPA